MKTIIQSGSELRLLALEPYERTTFGMCREYPIVESEITLLRIKKRKEVIGESVKLALELSLEHEVLYLNRFCYEPQIVEAVHAVCGDWEPQHLTQWTYGKQEISDNFDAIAKYIEESQTKIVVINSFEHAATTPRHQRLFVDQLRMFCSLGCAVVVVTQDMRKNLSSGEFGVGALGMLASLSSNVINFSTEDEICSYKAPPEDPNAIHWIAEIDMKTCKQLFNADIWEYAKPQDFPFLLTILKDRQKQILEDRIRVKGVHNKLPEDEIETRFSVLAGDKLLEIQEFEKRVQEMYAQGAFVGIYSSEKYLQELRGNWGMELVEARGIIGEKMCIGL